MPNLILTGFSGTGKSAAGAEVARLLDLPFIDTDVTIARKAGKTIAAIFAEDGEAVFRQMETAALKEACGQHDVVIATGAGALATPGNQDLALRSGLVICLEATPETVASRLNELQSTDNDDSSVRPLLAGPKALARIRSLKATRQPIYALAHWTIHTDNLTIDEVAHEVVHGRNRLQGQPTSNLSDNNETPAALVRTSAGTCPIYVSWGILNSFASLIKAAGLTSVSYIISDTGVFPHYGSRVQQGLEKTNIPVHTLTLPLGEDSKSLGTASTCYQWLAERRAERNHLIIALGGGVIGDLGGFVAATFNRGLPFVQVPTSLAAMVDASIGGKTAVNLPQGKNLVGLFRQPRMVVADVQTLTTLPRREMASGWAEAIKHGLILDANLLETFESRCAEIEKLEQPIATEVIQRSVAIKADVVSRDERETLGIRTLLNYGHTIGHALETASGYGTLLHGEAVSVGMSAAARISKGMGLLAAADVARQDRLLSSFGLPIRYTRVDRDAVRHAMGVDKKTQAGIIQWVLLNKLGDGILSSDVPSELVDAVLKEVT